MSQTTAAGTPGNPYVGPQPFTRKESSFFFGRDLEARQLLTLVLSERLVLFYAQSGAGKSSLINARLVIDLEKQNFFVLPVARVSGRNTLAPDGQKVSNVFIYSLLNNINDQTVEGEKPAITPDMTLSAFLRLYSGPSMPEPGAAEVQLEALPQILIIDQFEELFTTHPAEWKKREDFFLQIRQAMEEDPKLWVLLALREDFVALVDPYAYLFPGRLRARFYMQRLNEIAAGQAISEPARVVHREYQPEAVTELVRRLRQIPSDGPGGEELDQFVEPLILQVVCYNLFESLAGKPVDSAITLQDLEDDAAGNVDRALINYFNKLVLARVLAESRPKTDEERPVSEMALRLWIETRLVTPEGRRSFVYEEQGSGSLLPPHIVHMLYEKRLLNQGRREERIWYELAHDRLVRPIRAANDAWWREQGILALAARAWLTSGHAESTLALDPAIEQAIELADEQLQDPLVVDFLVQARKKFKRDLSTTGWGVIFAENADPAVREALEELLSHRRRQATQRCPHYYREFAYHPGMTSIDFLNEHNAPEGTYDPNFVPYFLLIVGDPVAIPFTFQYQLDVDYAVGRIAFERPADYAAYAHSVVEAERRPLTLSRQAVFYSPSHAGIKVSSQVIDQLVRPIVEFLKNRYPEWEITALLTPQETLKSQLRELLGGKDTPALLLTTTMSPPYPKGHQRQESQSGGLITSDWPGPPVKFDDEMLYSAADVPADASIFGLVAFFLTNRSAGTPRLNDFARARGLNQEKEQADRDFVARLPMRLLSHPAGGALAVIGHVDDAYSFTIGGLSGKGNPTVIRDLLSHLLSGLPVGAAMDAFNQRYTMLSSMLFGLQSQAAQMEDIPSSAEQAEKMRQAQLEMATIDARNYIILGDPAVRLTVGKSEGAQQERPSLSPPAGTWSVRYHPSPVQRARWSPNGQRLLTVCQDGSLRIWQPDTLEPEWARLGENIVDAAWSPDGERIAALYGGGEVVLLEQAGQGLEAARLSPGPDQAGCLAWSPDGTQLAVTSDILRRGVYLARIWDIAAGKVVQVLRGHTGLINTIDYHPDGSRILTAARDGTARLWANNGEILQEFTLLDESPAETDLALTGARFSPDGSRIVMTGGQGKIIISAEKGITTRTAIQPLCTAAFHRDGETLVEAGEDGTARAYAPDRAGLLEFRGHSGPLNAVEFSADGERLLTAGADGDLRLWNVISRLPTNSGGSGLACYSPHSLLLAGDLSKDRLEVWETSRLQPVYAISHDTVPLMNLIFSPDGASLVAQDRSGDIQVYAANDGALRHTISGGAPGRGILAFSPDGRWLLSDNAEKTITVWDAASGEIKLKHESASYVTQARFSLDGRLIYLLNLDGSLELIDWSTGAGSTIALSHPGGIRCVSFGYGSELLATGGDDGTVRVWHTVNGDLAHVLAGHQGPVYHVGFGSRGEFLLSGGADHSLRIWDYAHDQEMKAYFDFPGEVHFVKFAPGKKIVVGRWKGSGQARASGVIAWDISTRRPLLSWSLADLPISQVLLRPDNKQLLVQTETDIFLLPFGPGMLPALVSQAEKPDLRAKPVLAAKPKDLSF